MSATYVYGIVHAELAVPAELVGLDGAPVELVAHEGVAALVSSAPTERPLGTREDLFAHEKVVDTVASDVTVLPMRPDIPASMRLPKPGAIRPSSSSRQSSITHNRSRSTGTGSRSSIINAPASPRPSGCSVSACG